MLCELSHQFPLFVEQFLDRGRGLRRRFREESVTDLLMGSMMASAGASVIVEFPDEPVTGADMEWNFVNRDDRTYFRILLQAKQSYGNGDIWTRHGYKELLHQSGKPPAPQAATLCMTARMTTATYPLFMFYHPGRTCAMARGDGFNNVMGVSLADGYEIERLVVGSTTRTLRTRNKSLGRIAPLLFTLSDIFCPPNILPMGPMAFAAGRVIPLYVGRIGSKTIVGRPTPPTPHEVQQRLVSAILALPEGQEKSEAEAPAVPSVANEIPEHLMRLLEGHRGAIGKTEGLRRWRVTFVSQNPIDVDADLMRMGRR